MTLTSENLKTEVFKKKMVSHENQSLKIHTKKSQIVLEFFNMANSSWILGTFPNLHSNLRFFPRKGTS
jgi:hypothetical protein